jgi:hypothetical protein
MWCAAGSYLKLGLKLLDKSTGFEIRSSGLFRPFPVTNEYASVNHSIKKQVARWIINLNTMKIICSLDAAGYELQAQWMSTNPA